MSDSIDLEAIDSVITNLGHVGQRITVMATAVGSFDGGAELPGGVDLSGVGTALKALEAVYEQTYSQYNSLITMVKNATKADKGWGDHVKGWLTPPKTGHHVLDGVLGAPASVGAGVTDVGHDLGAGVVGLAADFNPVSNWHSYQHGDIMPIQRPGLGLINMGAHPLDTVKAAGGYQYRNDRLRMGSYAGANLLAMIATGGLGEVAEAGMSARLAQLAERSTGAAGARMAAEIDAATTRLNSLPGSRQRNPAKRRYVRDARASATRDLNRAMDRLRELEAAHASRIARTQAAEDALLALRNHPVGKLVSAAQSLFVTTVIDIVHPGPGRLGAIAHHAVAEFTELSGLGSSGQSEADRERVRRRLAEIAAAHAGRP